MLRTRLTRGLLAGAMLAVTLLPVAAEAAAPVQVILDGSPVRFETTPIIVENLTMVPVRDLLTPLGAELHWDPESQAMTAILSGKSIQAVLGSQTALVDGQTVGLALPVWAAEGRTYVPLRSFVESLGMVVAWDAESQSVLINSHPTAVESREAVEREEAASRSAIGRAGQMALSVAAQQIGAAYAWGGSSPQSGFDCSGFVRYVASQAGLDLPRTSYEMFSIGLPVDQASLAAGDLVFFSTYDDGASHVGIYDGAGNFVHAQSPERGVTSTPMSSPWWAARYLGARRVFR